MMTKLLAAKILGALILGTAGAGVALHYCSICGHWCPFGR